MVGSGTSQQLQSARPSSASFASQICSNAQHESTVDGFWGPNLHYMPGDAFIISVSNHMLVCSAHLLVQSVGHPTTMC